MRLMGSADPDSTLFPAAAFWSCLNESRADRSLLGYGSPQGDAQLRATLLPYLRARGIRAEPEEIIISSGVTQGLSLITQALARPGDVIAVEQPAYMGFLNLLRAQGLQPVGVPLDEEGPRLDALEALAKGALWTRVCQLASSSGGSSAPHEQACPSWLKATSDCEQCISAQDEAGIVVSLSVTALFSLLSLISSLGITLKAFVASRKKVGIVMTMSHGSGWWG
jgi:hypothetical protein